MHLRFSRQRNQNVRGFLWSRIFFRVGFIFFLGVLSGYDQSQDSICILYIVLIKLTSKSCIENCLGGWTGEHRVQDCILPAHPLPDLGHPEDPALEWRGAPGPAGLWPGRLPCRRLLPQLRGLMSEESRLHRPQAGKQAFQVIKYAYFSYLCFYKLLQDFRNIEWNFHKKLSHKISNGIFSRNLFIFNLILFHIC